jgi:hypothetical protein
LELAYFGGYRYTPYSTEQGIISAQQGILAQEQGILSTSAGIFADEIFDHRMSG